MPDWRDLTHYPTKPGIYLMRDSVGGVLYIGKGKNLRQRLQQYFSEQDKRAMIPHLLGHIAKIEIVLVGDEKEALLLEHRLIQRHKPRYNAQLKDDKTEISIYIDDTHPWPRAQLVRQRAEKGKVFGPYTSAEAAKETLALLNRAFPLRECSDTEFARRKRPCLLYQIKRCLAPCVGKCTKREYHTHYRSALEFLQGKDSKQRKSLLERLKRDMEKASAEMAYERAGELLRSIKALENTANEQKLLEKMREDCDAFAIVRSARHAALARLVVRSRALADAYHTSCRDLLDTDEEFLTAALLARKEDIPPLLLIPFPLPERESLEEILSERANRQVRIEHPTSGNLAELVTMAEDNAHFLLSRQTEAIEDLLADMQTRCDLSKLPHLIECIDVSHLGGSDRVAVVVGFRDGVRASVRYYRLPPGQDDHNALRNTIERRLQKGHLPEVLLIDGGEGHLSTAFAALEGIEITPIALAKEVGRHDLGLNAERVFTLNGEVILSRSDPLLFFLQRMRDETHRMAINFHRRQRKQRTITSSLSKVAGIGPVKEKKLLKAFGNLDKIRNASDRELIAAGLSQRDLIPLRRFLAPEPRELA